MHANYQIHDHFYPNPREVRAFALGCSYRRAESSTWNGFYSDERDPGTKEAFFRIASLISDCRTPNWDDIETSYQFWGKPSAGRFALLLRNQSDTVHFHQRSGAWAGVCYLALPEHCAFRDGVSFYRHRPTGLDTYLGADTAAFEQVKHDAGDRTKWELLFTIPMEYNRLVVFDGRFFHAASDGFGTSAETGRLAQLFNIDFLD